MLAKFNPAERRSFDGQHAADELRFDAYTAGDPAANYANWDVRRRIPHVTLSYNLSAFAPRKEVVLGFRFDATSQSRIQIYTDAALLDEEILEVGDNQFLLEVESTSSLFLHFVHVHRAVTIYGGDWYFRGIDGYVG